MWGRAGAVKTANFSEQATATAVFWYFWLVCGSTFWYFWLICGSTFWYFWPGNFREFPGGTFWLISGSTKKSLVVFSYDNLWLISGPGSFSRERPGTPGNYHKFGPQIRTKSSDQKFGPKIRTKNSDHKFGPKSRTKKSDEEVGPKSRTSDRNYLRLRLFMGANQQQRAPRWISRMLSRTCSLPRISRRTTP